MPPEGKVAGSGNNGSPRHAHGLVFSSKGPTASVKHNRGVKCEVGDEPDTDTDIVTTTPTVTPTPTTSAAFVSFFEGSMLAARSVTKPEASSMVRNQIALRPSWI